jgi:ribonucleoside-diphosphate reductase beta chain
MSIFDFRESYKPFEYDVSSFSEAVEDTYWVGRELKKGFNSDVEQYKTELSDHDRSIISRVLKTFAEVETHVANDLWSKLVKFTPKHELAGLGYCFADNERRHADSYSLLNELLGIDKHLEPYSKDPVLSEKFDNLVESSLNFEFDKENIDHIRKFAFGLAVFSAFTERVDLFGQFMILKSFSCNGRNYLRNVGTIIDWSKQDESLHGKFGIFIFNEVKKEFPEIWNNEFKSSIYTSFTQGMKIQEKVIDDVFSDGDLPNLNKFQVLNYMKYLCNDSLKELGLKEIFDINPKLLSEVSWFEDESNATQMTDFLAGTRSTDYTKNQVAYTSEEVALSDQFLSNLESKFTSNRND